MAEADPQTIFNVTDAAVLLDTLADRAHEGEEIVLYKNGVPWARLSPCLQTASAPASNAVSQPRTPGRLKGLLGDIPDSVWFDPLPEDELALWEGKRLEKYGY